MQKSEEKGGGGSKLSLLVLLALVPNLGLLCSSGFYVTGELAVILTCWMDKRLNLYVEGV